MTWGYLFSRLCPNDNSLILKKNIQRLQLLQVYKKKTEAAKKDYLKALAAYRASLVSKVIFNLQYH